MKTDEKICVVDPDLDDAAMEEVVKDRIVIAMSGGVDSSVAAAIVTDQGYDAVGITMRLYSTPQSQYKKSCCSPDDLFDARMVADRLGIPFYVANYEKEFKKRVIDYFVDEYRRGRTPNPCVACNNHLKFDVLLQRSLKLGAKYLATGHFARIDRSDEVTVMRKGLDDAKDQSYFLFGIPREALPRILFPLGEMTKGQVRDRARKMNLETADKAESQEICFVTGSSYKDFVAKRLEDNEITPGKIVNEDGTFVANHDGIHNFTVGQRKGLGGGFSEAHFVLTIRPEDGTVVIGKKKGLFAKGLKAVDCNWLSFEKPPLVLECEVRIRYRATPVACTVKMEEDVAVVEFAERLRAVTPGQAAVFYRGDEVLGGGWISEGLF